MCYGYLMQNSEDNDKPTDTEPSGDFDENGHLVKPEKKGQRIRMNKRYGENT